MQYVKLFNNNDEALKVVPQKKLVLVKVGKLRVCLTRFGDKLFAFRNECPHMSYPLNEGVVSPHGEVICAWHNYQFNLMSGNERYDRCSKLTLLPLLTNENGEIQLVIK
jgi:nitrite reductase/ring-hydroxylating ferredoxin subunit